MSQAASPKTAEAEVLGEQSEASGPQEAPTEASGGGGTDAPPAEPLEGLDPELTEKNRLRKRFFALLTERAAIYPAAKDMRGNSDLAREKRRGLVLELLGHAPEATPAGMEWNTN